MITDLGIWTVIVSFVALAFAIQYSRLASFLAALRWLVWDFSGIGFISSKLLSTKDSDSQARAPLLFWLIAVYTGLFAVTSLRYEAAALRVENRMDAFITQLAVAGPNVRKASFREVAEIQDMACPQKPYFITPSSVYLSLIRSGTYEDAGSVLTRTVERYKDDLEGAFLLRANLEHAHLRGAHLEGAVLEQAHLENADLSQAHLADALLARTDLASANLSRSHLEGALMWKARLDGASLRGADLTGANLHSAVLQRADLEQAQLKDAILTAAHLEGAKSLTIDQLCSVKTLFQTKLDPEQKRLAKLQCPQVLEYAEIERRKKAD